HETVFEDRLGYSAALNGMGARIETTTRCLGRGPCRFYGGNHVHSAVVVGPSELHGAELRVPDLRSGFAYLIAALTASGKSVLHDTHHIARGYEDVWNKARALGAVVSDVGAGN